MHLFKWTRRNVHAHTINPSLLKGFTPPFLLRAAVTYSTEHRTVLHSEKEETQDKSRESGYQSRGWQVASWGFHIGICMIISLKTSLEKVRSRSLSSVLSHGWCLQGCRCCCLVSPGQLCIHLSRTAPQCIMNQCASLVPRPLHQSAVTKVHCLQGQPKPMTEKWNLRRWWIWTFSRRWKFIGGY